MRNREQRRKERSRNRKEQYLLEKELKKQEESGRLVFDENSGLYYDTVSQLYWEKDTNLYYSPDGSACYHWNNRDQMYMVVLYPAGEVEPIERKVIFDHSLGTYYDIATGTLYQCSSFLICFRINL